MDMRIFFKSKNISKYKKIKTSCCQLIKKCHKNDWLEK